MSPNQGFAIYGAEASDYSGWSVSTAGDVNKDGYPDIIIGAYNSDPNSRSNAGSSYVIIGSTLPVDVDLLNLNSTQGFAIYGAAANDNSG